MARVFSAQFAGPCGLCERRIQEGDDVCYHDDEVCHAECAEGDGEELER